MNMALVLLAGTKMAGMSRSIANVVMLMVIAVVMSYNMMHVVGAQSWQGCLIVKGTCVPMAMP
jgi:hypothetical protein